MNDHQERATDQRNFWRTASAFPEVAADDLGQAPPGTAAETQDSAEVSYSDSGVTAPPLGADCLLIGPPGSGKTSFVASLEQACLMEGDVRDRLRLSNATSLGPEVDKIVSALMSGGSLLHEAATKPRTYTCNVSRSRWRATEAVCNLRIRDEPGSRLFSANGVRHTPTLAWRERQSGRRRCLAIFIDPLCPAAGRWRLELPVVLRRLHQPGRLDAVLVLLSKIDLYCDRLARCSSAIESATGHRSTPVGLARRIDPWQQAIELLGAASVELLRTSVSSPGDLAFGVASAVGFDPESGRSLREGGHVLPDAELGKLWSPFGVYDALRFIAFGELAGHLAAPEAASAVRSRWHSIPLPY